MAGTEVGKIMARGAMIIFYLQRAPRTKGELSLLLGFQTERAGWAVVSRWISAMLDEGIIRARPTLRPTAYVSNHGGGRPAIEYEWIPIEEVDHEKLQKLDARADAVDAMRGQHTRG